MNRQLLVSACCVLLAVVAAGCGKNEEELSENPPPAGPILIERPAMILCEAEDADEVVEPFAVASFEGASDEESQTASGGRCLEIPKGDAKGGGVNVGGSATLSFDVAETGEYVFWARVYFIGSCWNSFGIEVDGYRIKKPGTADEIGPPEIFSNNYNPPHWHWVSLKRPDQKPIKFSLKKGPHTLVVHNTEDGVKLDQFLFTTEADPDKWYPVGIMEQ